MLEYLENYKCCQTSRDPEYGFCNTADRQYANSGLCGYFSVMLHHFRGTGSNLWMLDQWYI